MGQSKILAFACAAALLLLHFVVLLPDGYVLGNLAYSAYFVAAWVALAALPRWLYRAPWLNRFDQFMMILQPLVALGFLVSFMATRVTAVVLAAPFLFAVYCVFAWLRSRWGILRGARRLNSRELALKRKQPYTPDPENSVTAIAIDGLLGGMFSATCPRTHRHPAGAVPAPLPTTPNAGRPITRAAGVQDAHLLSRASTCGR